MVNLKPKRFNKPSRGCFLTAPIASRQLATSE